MGGSAVTTLGERAIDNDSKGGLQQQNDANLRRSIYLPVVRNDLPQAFEVFDFADPDVTTGRRDATTVATQALYLMNSGFALESSRAAAKRLLSLQGDDAARLTDLYRRSLGRSPSDKERDAVLKFLADFRRSAAKAPTQPKAPAATPDEDAWSAVCLAVFGCTEFRFTE
jgi:hypothetical protein